MRMYTFFPLFRFIFTVSLPLLLLSSSSSCWLSIHCQQQSDDSGGEKAEKTLSAYKPYPYTYDACTYICHSFYPHPQLQTSRTLCSDSVCVFSFFFFFFSSGLLFIFRVKINSCLTFAFIFLSNQKTKSRKKSERRQWTKKCAHMKRRTLQRFLSVSHLNCVQFCHCVRFAGRFSFFVSIKTKTGKNKFYYK